MSDDDLGHVTLAYAIDQVEHIAGGHQYDTEERKSLEMVLELARAATGRPLGDIADVIGGAVQELDRTGVSTRDSARAPTSRIAAVVSRIRAHDCGAAAAASYRAGVTDGRESATCGGNHRESGEAAALRRVARVMRVDLAESDRVGVLHAAADRIERLASVPASWPSIPGLSELRDALGNAQDGTLIETLALARERIEHPRPIGSSAAVVTLRALARAVGLGTELDLNSAHDVAFVRREVEARLCQRTMTELATEAYDELAEAIGMPNAAMVSVLRTARHRLRTCTCGPVEVGQAVSGGRALELGVGAVVLETDARHPYALTHQGGDYVGHWHPNEPHPRATYTVLRAPDEQENANG